MKITKSQLRKIIKEETQGEMEFAPLEAARQAYLQEPNDDTKHEFGLMINKLVEPIMAEMGLFWEAEAYYNRGDLVFNNRSVEVSIDPRGAMGRYDVNVSAQVSAMDTDPAFEPIEIAIPSMKGVLQFVNDKVFSSTGMVGEPEAQTELPLEHKMRITKSQLQKIIKEETAQALREDASDDTFEMVDVIVQALGPQQALEELVQAMERSNAQDLLGYVMQNHEIRMPGNEVEDYNPNDF
jgi:hypothetical protein